MGSDIPCGGDGPTWCLSRKLVSLRPARISCLLCPPPGRQGSPHCRCLVLQSLEGGVICHIGHHLQCHRAGLRPCTAYISGLDEFREQTMARTVHDVGSHLLVLRHIYGVRHTIFSMSWRASPLCLRISELLDIGSNGSVYCLKH